MENKNVIITETRTGKIFCDVEKGLEFLYVGDYGKENNIKANFLGLTKEINGVKHEKVDLSYKMVVTISTQKGCPMSCRFCDCPKVKFRGNADVNDLSYQVETAIDFSKCKYTKRFNLHLARMGEPSLNYKNVFKFLKDAFPGLVNGLMKADVIHPVFTTMLPKSIEYERMKDILNQFCSIKNEDYSGEAGLQLSINSTSQDQRDYLFNGRSHTLKDISKMAELLPNPVGRKYTLNFPVTKDTILDADELDRLFDKDKFIVKITPIHETRSALENNIETTEGYYSYNVYSKFESPLIKNGWDVIVFIPSKEEDEDRITCGNALLSVEK